MFVTCYLLFVICNLESIKLPANLTPEYHKAEKWYRNAGSDSEKILALEQMLRVIPKHKGTDHLRADLRRRLSKSKEAAGKRSSTKSVDIFHIPKSGAGQVVLIGAPNSGKSSIVAELTNAKATVADFPFATSVPLPGMVSFEDIQIQLVDMPPITAEYCSPGQVGTYRNCNLIGVVIDLSGNVDEQWSICLDFLESRRLLIDAQTPSEDEDGNMLARKAFIVGTKSDMAPGGAVRHIVRLCKDRFDFITTGGGSKRAKDKLAKKLFELLGVIRIYSKPPGKRPDMNEPFTLPKGSTVMDLAGTIHRELEGKLKSARIWGSGVYDGQNVHKSHVLNDRDIVELHFG